MLDKRTKQAMLVTVLGVCLYVALTHLPAVFSALRDLSELMQPVIIGGILALFIAPELVKEDAIVRIRRKERIYGEK